MWGNTYIIPFCKEQITARVPWKSVTLKERVLGLVHDDKGDLNIMDPKDNAPLHILLRNAEVPSQGLFFALVD